MKVSRLFTLDEFLVKNLKEKNVNMSGLVESLLFDWIRKISKSDELRLIEEKKIIEEKIVKEAEDRLEREERRKKDLKDLLEKLNECETWKSFNYSTKTTDEEIMELNRKLRELKFRIDFVTLKEIFKGINQMI